MSKKAEDAIEVGGPYVENPDHVPALTDMVAQYNTSGLGAHMKIEETSQIFAVDKVNTAAEIVGALDPDNTEVSSDRVMLPGSESETDPEVAKENLLSLAEARLDEGVVIGGPTPAQEEAAQGADDEDDDSGDTEDSGSGDSDDGVLKGAALDEALESAGLSKSGTVAEKRDRLAEYEKSQQPS